MIALRNITLTRGNKTLLESANWTIHAKQRIGLIGANGSGKTSIFAMLLGQLTFDQGTLDIPTYLSFAHVAQETPALRQTAHAFVIAGDTELARLQQALASAEQQQDMASIATLHMQLEDIDAYTAAARAARLLDGLGFSYTAQQQSVSSFSGGWRARLNLAQALMCRSHVLLLDEPTNHLDLDAVVWLEQWLNQYQGTLLIISHDRDFLDHIVNDIVYLNQQKLFTYPGNYSAFEKQRAAQLMLQQATYTKQQKQITHLQQFIDRFRAKASKAKQAQSRLKAIERMELVNQVHIDTAFEFHFKEPRQCPHPLFILHEVSLHYGDTCILNKINLNVAPQDRIALLGPNGAGKTTLIKAIAGEIPITGGIRQVGNGIKIGYFAQQQIDSLMLTETPLGHVRQLVPEQTEQALRIFLGGFGFSGTRVFEPVSHFSGGEKARLALALLVIQQPNLLLLDEPTNHLDLDMRHALTIALQAYQGAMILVSHDRFMIRTTADQLLLVNDGSLHPFAGDLDDYQQWLLQLRKSSKTIATLTTSPTSMSLLAHQERRTLLNKIKKLEDTLADLQQQMSAVTTRLADDTLYQSDQQIELEKCLSTQQYLAKQLQETENLWLATYEALDQFK